MTHYLTRVQTYYCDGRAGCNQAFEEPGSAREVWAEARRVGWRTRKGGHYCPEHAHEASDARLCVICGARYVVLVNGRSACADHIDTVMGAAFGPTYAAMTDHTDGSAT